MKRLPLIISAIVVAVMFTGSIGYILNVSVKDRHHMVTK